MSCTEKGTPPPEPEDPRDLPETIPITGAGRAQEPSTRLGRLRASASADRYQLRGRLGHGGQGVVYEVWDEDLRRTLAMKVVLERSTSTSVTADTADTADTPATDPETLSRFLEEAQITGQLNHPGIVPVHELGLDPNGQVYFTMRLVRGENLHEIFERIHAGDGEWTQLRALGALLKACEAVAYAHAKKVIHRDLKPSNLMGGKYGEVYVMDWGLARVLGQEDPHDLRLKEAPQTSSLRTDRKESREGNADSPLITMDGRVMGTPSYMPPEQAEGRIEAMGPASDVYSMGAVLYQLLTGRIPYVPPTGHISPRTVLARVLEGPPTPVSELAPGAPAELVAIQEKAMARRMEERYPDMQALAVDLRAFLEGRVVSAFESGPWAELRKWILRNRGWAATAATAFAVLVVALGWALAERERADDAAFAAALSAASERSAKEDALRSAASEREAKLEALAARALAETRELEAEAARDAEAERAEELELVVGFQEAQLSGIDVPLMGVRLRGEILEQARAASIRQKYSPEEVESRSAELEALLTGTDFTGAGLSLLEGSIFERALAVIDRDFESEPLVRARLQQAVASTVRELGLLDLARDPQERALATRKEILGDESHWTLHSIHEMGNLLVATGRYAEAEARFREAYTTRQRLLGDDDPRTIVSQGNLGSVLMEQGRLTEAEPYQAGALEASRRIGGDATRDTLRWFNNQGALLQAMGRFSEAEPYYQKALDGTRATLGEDDPQTLHAQNNMGFLLQAQGKFAESREYFREALDRRLRVLGAEHPDTLLSMNNLGYVHQELGDLDDAQAVFEEALATCQRVHGERHALTHTLRAHLASLFMTRKEFERASEHLSLALDSRRLLLGEVHPETLNLRICEASLLHDLGRDAEAEDAYRNTIALCERTPDLDPRLVIPARGNLGLLLQRQGRFEEAEELLRMALAERRRLDGDDHPGTIGAVHNLGGLLFRMGEIEEAEQCAAEVLRYARVRFPPRHWRTGLTLNGHGQALMALGRFAEAQVDLEEAYGNLEETFGEKDPRTTAAAANLVSLHEAWHEKEPDAGHDAEAARWRRHLAVEESESEGGS